MEENKPRWEVKYEKYSSPEFKKKMSNLKGRITRYRNMEKNPKGTTSEEYRANKVKAMQEREKLENDPELKAYQIFEKNRDKIANIKEYRDSLLDRISKLPKDNAKLIEQKRIEVQAKNERIDNQEHRVDELLTEINSMKMGEERLAKQVELEKTLQSIQELKGQMPIFVNEIGNLVNKQKYYEEKVIPQKLNMERRISKCNIIAANLLKGKSIEDIDLRLSEEKYTSPDGKMKKNIAAAKAERSVEREEQLENSENNVTENNRIVEENTTNALTNPESFEIKHPRLAKLFARVKSFGSSLWNRIKNIGTRENDEKETEKSIGEKVGEEVSKMMDEKNKTEKNPSALEDTLKLNQDEKFVDKEMAENELLRKITEDGKDKTFREILKVNKERALENDRTNHQPAISKETDRDAR